MDAQLWCNHVFREQVLLADTHAMTGLKGLRVPVLYTHTGISMHIVFTDCYCRSSSLFLAQEPQDRLSLPGCCWGLSLGHVLLHMEAKSPMSVPY